MLKRLFLLALFFVCAPGARAGILVDFTGASGNQWHYDVSLTPGLFLQQAGNGAPGSFFTVYDFKGLQSIGWDPVPALNGSGDWSVTQSLTSTVPGQVDPNIDNPTLPNATVTFTRAQPFDPGATIFKLGTLTLTGMLAGPTDPTKCGAECAGQPFAAETWQAGNPPLLFDNLSQTLGPSAVPEPSTYGLMIAGLVAVGVLTRRRVGKR
jgi:hypothetical protein